MLFYYLHCRQGFGRWGEGSDCRLNGRRRRQNLRTWSRGAFFLTFSWNRGPYRQAGLVVPQKKPPDSQKDNQYRGAHQGNAPGLRPPAGQRGLIAERDCRRLLQISRRQRALAVVAQFLGGWNPGAALGTKRQIRLRGFQGGPTRSAKGVLLLAGGAADRTVFHNSPIIKIGHPQEILECF